MIASTRQEPPMNRRLFPLLTLLAVFWSGWAAAIEPEDVSFPTLHADGTMLKALLFRSAGDGPHPAVVMMHGCSGAYLQSGRLRSNYRFWTQHIAEQGYAVLLVDGFRPRGYRTICGKRDRPLDPYADRPYDAHAALKFLAARADIARDRIALMGWSNGAMATLGTLLHGASHRPAGAGPEFRAGIGFYPGCVVLRKKGIYRPVAPVLVLIGLADDWTLPKPCFALVDEANKWGGGAKMEIEGFEGAYHAFDHPNNKLHTVKTRNSVYASGEKIVHTGTNHEARAAAIQRVDAWLAKFLRGG
jgi:dienelactone hydrolase